jgi:hypothetical protein
MLHPVAARSSELTAENAIAPERPVTLVVREPAAYFRFSIEARNLRLEEYAIPEPSASLTFGN